MRSSSIVPPLARGLARLGESTVPPARCRRLSSASVVSLPIRSLSGAPQRSAFLPRAAQHWARAQGVWLSDESSSSELLHRIAGHQRKHHHRTRRKYSPALAGKDNGTRRRQGAKKIRRRSSLACCFRVRITHSSQSLLSQLALQLCLRLAKVDSSRYQQTRGGPSRHRVGSAVAHPTDGAG